MFKFKTKQVHLAEPFDKYPKELDNLRGQINQVIFFDSFPGKVLSFERENIGLPNETSIVWYSYEQDKEIVVREFSFHISRAAHNEIVKKLTEKRDNEKTPE